MEITYKQFKKFEGIYDTYKDEPNLLTIKMIKIFSGKEPKELSIDELDEIEKAIADELSKEDYLIRKFNRNGINYGIIPNFSKITTGELIDLDTLMSENDLLGVCRILYRPIESSNKDTYTIREYDGTSDLDDISWHICRSAISFFVQSFHHLKRITHTSIK